MPWTLGPGSHPTSNQQTRKPARQRTSTYYIYNEHACKYTYKQTTNKPQGQRGNKPTDQETKKPRHQQGNKPTPSQARRTEMNPQTNQKIKQKINQKSTKMAPKLVLEAVLGASWGFLGRLGAVLAPR